jgi:hypothetical protein
MTPLHIATSYMLGWRRDANDEETVVLHALARDR